MSQAKNRIREVLDEKGIRQKWLAEKMGKSFNAINSFVCNRRQPGLEQLFEITEILDVKSQNLIKDKNDKHNTTSCITS